MIAFKVLKQLNLPPETQFSFCNENGDVDRARRPWDILPTGHKIGIPEPLFKEMVCFPCRLVLDDCLAHSLMGGHYGVFCLITINNGMAYSSYWTQFCAER